MAIKVVNSVRDLSQLDRMAFGQLLSTGQKAIFAIAPYMEQKLLDDLLKSARVGQNPAVVAWLAARGYRVSTPAEAGAGTNTPTASQTTQVTSGRKKGDVFQVTNPRGGVLNRYYWIDDNGDEWGLVTKNDPTTADYLNTNGKYTLVDTDADGRIIAPGETTLANKYYDTITGSWKDSVSTDPFANLGGDPNAPLSATDQANVENTQADTNYRNALTQQLLADINSPTTTDSQKNDAAIQLYGILASYANNNNQNAVSQWGNQAGAFNQAYGNAIDQNKWLQDMSTSPLNTVAYLNLMRGEMPPNWNLPNYQKMPDAFQGWNQPAPTTQGLPDVATIQSILAGLGYGGGQQTTPTPTPTPQYYNTQTQQTYPVTQPVSSWSNVLTPEQDAAENALRNSRPPLPTNTPSTNGMVYFNGQYYPAGWQPPVTQPVTQPVTKQKAADASPSQGGVNYLW